MLENWGINCGVPNASRSPENGYPATSVSEACCSWNDAAKEIREGSLSHCESNASLGSEYGVVAELGSQGFVSRQGPSWLSTLPPARMTSFKASEMTHCKDPFERSLAWFLLLETEVRRIHETGTRAMVGQSELA